MKTKRIMPLLLSVIMTAGAVTAVPFKASAAELNAPVVSSQSARSSLATPKISKAESVNNGVKISWGRVNGAARYRVYYKGSKGWRRLADTTSTAYTDKAVSSGKNYTYTVRCISADAKRFTSGYDSKGKSVKFLSVPKIKKTENVYGGVKLTWSRVSGAEKYRVYCKKNNKWKGLGNTTSTSFIDTKAMSDHNCTYTVRCITKDGRNFASGYDGKGKSILYTASPKLLNAGAAYSGIRIEWKEVIGAEKYRVYVKNGKSWKKLADTTSTTFNDKNVSAKKTYTYTVRCINSSANKFTSGYDSKGVTVTTPAKPTQDIKIGDNYENLGVVTGIRYYKNHDEVKIHHYSEWVSTTREEPVFSSGYIDVCNNCGQELADSHQLEEHMLWEVRENDGWGSYHAVKVTKQVGTKIVEGGHWTEEWEETISHAYYEKVSADDDWDLKQIDWKGKSMSGTDNIHR